MFSKLVVGLLSLHLRLGLVFMLDFSGSVMIFCDSYFLVTI